MLTLSWVLILALTVSANSQQSFSQQSLPQTGSIPASCPVTTRPKRAFIPPADYRNIEWPPGEFFIGTNELWTSLGEPMVWHWTPHSPKQILTAKIFWYREGYSWDQEPIPKLKVTGRRIDGPAPPLVLPYERPSHAIMGPHTGAMLTGVYVPAPGCWEITGDYAGDKLSFVVWVEPEKPEPAKSRR